MSVRFDHLSSVTHMRTHAHNTHTHTQVHAQTLRHAQMFECAHVHTHTHTHTLTHSSTKPGMHMRAHTCACTLTHTHTCTYSYTHTHTRGRGKNHRIAVHYCVLPCIFCFRSVKINSVWLPHTIVQRINCYLHGVGEGEGSCLFAVLSKNIIN